jgi:hypothetical protein
VRIALRITVVRRHRRAGRGRSGRGRSRCGVGSV